VAGLGPVPAQPSTRARGRVAWRVVRAGTPRTGTERPFRLPDRGTMPLTGSTLGLRAAAAMRGSTRTLGAPSTAVAPRNHPQIGDGAHCRGTAAAAQPAARPRPRRGFAPDARRAVDSGGSGETTPRLGTAHPLARGRRRGSTCRAPSAAVGPARLGTAFASAWHPVAARFTPELGSNEWLLTARRANGAAPAAPAPAGSVRRAGPGGRGHLAWRHPGRAGPDPASPAPHPTAPAISCRCNVTCSPTTGSRPRGRPSHRPASAQVCGKQPTRRVNSAASDGKVGPGVEKWEKVGYGGAQQTTGVAGLLPLRHSGLEPSRGQ
jgi:hypothetical protein